MPEAAAGAIPTYQLTINTDGELVLGNNSSPVRSHHRFRVGETEIERLLEAKFPPEIADLISIGLAVYLADRVCPRPRTRRYELGWQRRIRITIQVRNLDLWRDAELTRLLTDAVEFYTEDEWEFAFTPVESRVSGASAQGTLFPLAERVDRVALFSGGLDSLAGLCSELTRWPNATFLLFAATTSRRTQAIQARLANELCQRVDRAIIPCFVPFGLIRREPRAFDRDEDTQRSRGFVFAMLGAATAILADVRELNIYENGVGAINLPYSGAQLGLHLTRATHPLALQKMGRLIEKATGQPFSFSLPFLFTTKGQLCTSLEAYRVTDLANVSISCDGFPQRVRDKPQCGLCTSCILRRQALFTAGLYSGDRAAGYREDIFGSLHHVSDSKLYPFRSMVLQANRISEVMVDERPWDSLCARFPQLLELAVRLQDSASTTSVGGQLLQMYRTYAEEWQQFPPRPPRLRVWSPLNGGYTYGT
jgi:hypothetical protein